MPIALLVHNIGYACCMLLSLIFGMFVLVRGWNKKPNIFFFLTSYAYVFYCATYLLGVNQADPHISQAFTALGVISIFIVCFNSHLAFSVFNIERQQKKFLYFMYASGIALQVFFLLDINRFHQLPVQWGYFPNFIVPGPFYWLFTIYFFGVVVYFLGVLMRLYPKVELAEKNRLKYFILSFVFGYGFAIPIFTNIFGLHQVDMLFTVLIGFYTIPLGYAVFRYNLINISVAARNVALYTLATVTFTGIITLTNVLNNFLILRYDNFPIWLLPIFMGIAIMLFGLLMLRKIREADLLKYEFINNISHKFRTPLTHIRWLAEDLRSSTDQTERDNAVEQIQFASMRLFELTNAVIDVSETNNDLLLYHFSSVDVADIVKEIDKAHQDQILHKKLNVHVDIGPDIPKVKADKTRLQFALQILFENSLIYTPEGGTIDIKLRQIAGEIVVSFRDTGIGINQAEIPFVFSKFYRSQNARRADTEGMGIGLFMAKNILEKHNGRIWVESQGEGSGSTFSISLPL